MATEGNVASTITAHFEDILERWRSAIALGVSARGLTRAECLNVMPMYLRSLANSGLEPLGTESPVRDDIVEEHLGSRLRHGFDLREIVEEFGVLGRCLSDVWAELPGQERPCAAEVEQLQRELLHAAEHVARTFETHMRDDEQSDKRLARRLETAMNKAAWFANGGFDWSAALAIFAEATGAEAATILLVDVVTETVATCDSIGDPVACAALRDLARAIDRVEEGFFEETHDPIASRQPPANEALRGAGLHRALVTRLPAPQGRCLAVALATVDTHAFTPREIRRVEWLADRLAFQMAGAHIDGELLSTIAGLRAERVSREEFVAVLAHDLRGPISTAHLQADFLARTERSPDGLKSGIQRIQRVLVRADRMVSALLDANRIKAGEPLPLELEELELVAFVGEVIEELSFRYPNRFVLDAEGPIVGRWCSEHLRRAIWNLGVNAIKYGADAAPVTIHTRLADGIASVAVHNEGVPIPPDEQCRLFDAFVRAESAGASGQPGWGLGLTLVRGVAEAHGGTVACASDAARGTTFTISLPLDFDAPNVVAGPLAPLASTSPSVAAAPRRSHG